MLCHTEIQPWPPGFLAELGEGPQRCRISTSTTKSVTVADMPQDTTSDPGSASPDGRQLAAEVKHELRVLREQLAGHHDHFLALVSSRLDRLLARCGGAGDNTDSLVETEKVLVPPLVVPNSMSEDSALSLVEHASTLSGSQAEHVKKQKSEPPVARRFSGSTTSYGREKRSSVGFGIQRPSDIKAAELREEALVPKAADIPQGSFGWNHIRSAGPTASMKPRLLRTMFAQPKLTQEKLVSILLKKEYRVEDRYSTDGCCQRVARSPWFEIATLSIIALNVVWIGYDVDKNPADVLPDSPIMFQVVENLFCCFFTFELLLRFSAFEHKQDSIRDRSFVFDSALLSVMIAETWFAYAWHSFAWFVLQGQMLALLRMLRLSRMVRLIRLLRAMPELMVLMRGFRAAFSSVAWTLCFLLIMIYVFSVAFNIFCKENSLGNEYFPSVLDGMSTLLLSGLMPESASIVTRMGKEHFLYAALFVCFAFAGTIMLTNMLIGILVEVVSAVAAMERDLLDVSFVEYRLQNLMVGLDKDNNSKLSKAEVEQLVLLPGASKVMNDVGVDVFAFCEIAEFYLFDRADEISFEDFVSLVLKLRGSNNVCVRDLVFLRQFIAEEIGNLEQQLKEFGLWRAPAAGERPAYGPNVACSAHEV